MAEPPPSRPYGSHRRAPGADRLAVLIISLVCVAIAAGLVIFALHKRGEPAHGDARSPAPSSHSIPPPSSSTVVASSASAPNASVTSGPPSSTPTASVATTPSAPAPTTTTGSPTRAALPSLDVLNDSRISGLAARATAQFRTAGWDVATTGNFHGTDVPETTIFYPEGRQAAADRLAADFRIHRVLPSPSSLSLSHLTIVLARDWGSRG